MCALVKDQSTSSDNCEMVNDRTGNELSIAADRLTVIKLTIVDNRLSNQSRESKPSRLAGDEFFSVCMVVPCFIGILEY